MMRLIEQILYSRLLGGEHLLHPSSIEPSDAREHRQGVQRAVPEIPCWLTERQASDLGEQTAPVDERAPSKGRIDE